MAQTNSHRSNTHVKRLSLSSSMLIIIITRLLATSRIITQHFNHLLYTILPPVLSKMTSHFQLSNFAIQGLEHSETDMNS